MIKEQSDFELIQSQLDCFNINYNTTQRKLYKDIISYFKLNNTNKLSNTKLNELKSSYQLKYKINARQFNSIYAELSGKISSVLELNKDYLKDTKDKVAQLTKAIKSKQNTLNDLIKKLSNKNYVKSHIDKVNQASLKTKLYYLKKKLTRANNKLAKLINIQKTGNPHLCFGSKKLFRQQFQINSGNNLTKFKCFSDWKKAWIESRNKSFILIGSSDEEFGNQNCQIKHIKENIYELKVNVNPKKPKLKDRYIHVQIKVHNDKNKLIQQAITNNNQALSYRFYKDIKNKTYKVFISLDKSKQNITVKSIKQLGTIGIDINADHLSISEVNYHGNLLKTFDIQLDLKDKSTQQAMNNIACAIKEITNYAVNVNKPIVIEKLNFNQKKKELKSGYNKNYNVMISSFAYSKIIELIKSRSFDKGIEVIEVNPAYTSKIGQFKYQNKYKLTTHQSAAFVIARRGLLSYNKFINVKVESKVEDKIVIEYKRKEVIVLNKEKTISIRSNKYYSFELPVRTIQRKENIYWKEVEQNYLKAKRLRVLSKKKKTLILGKNSSKSLPCELTPIVDNFGVNRDSIPNLLFQPF
jgi:IS605 OrfB family transposase